MERTQQRLPPGQVLTRKFPVLQYGEVAEVDTAAWRLKVYGEVKKEIELDWEDFNGLEQIKVLADMHCVTKWSKYDNIWEGVPFRIIAGMAGVKDSAKFVMAHSYDKYSTNVPLELLMEDDVVLAVKHNGELLSSEHGRPVRLVVPKRYGWKSAKWLGGLEFLDEDKKGYWEKNGYHNEGDPWKNQRFKWQENTEKCQEL